MRDVGAKIHRLKGMKLHGKMILADEKRAVIGSINLSPGSFDARRELAIETDAPHVIHRLVHATRHDWEHSREIDLTDEGLLADLKKRGAEHTGAEKLVLGKKAEPRHKRKHGKHKA